MKSNQTCYPTQYDLIASKSAVGEGDRTPPAKRVPILGSASLLFLLTLCGKGRLKQQKSL